MTRTGEDARKLASGMTLADVSIRNHVFAWVLMIVIWVPPSVASSSTRIRPTGMSGSGLPSGPAKPSSTSMVLGSSMLRKRQ